MRDKHNGTKKLKIGIFHSFFWGGGAELMRLIITSLLLKSETLPIEIYVLIPNHSISIKQKIKRLIKKLLFNNNNRLNEISLSKNQVLDYFNGINHRNLLFINYDQTKISLNKIIKENNIDVIIPFIGTPQQKLKIPWLGYIFDFQHKYLKNLFNEKEIKNRNKCFHECIKSAPAIIVNSKSVKEDILKFYPNINHNKIFNLPFAPIAKETWINSTSKFAYIKKKYNIFDSYFMISNQFWMHKSHETVFYALKLLLEKYKIDTNLICTGNTHDNRNPKYFHELKEKINQLSITNNVTILGHIPKEDQIKLMRNSIAIIQPTLFEGGPGGGSTYDAISLGIPAIISDIKINKEINDTQVIFFKAKNHTDLALKMLLRINKKKFEKPNKLFLIQKMNNNSEKLGSALLESINFAMKLYDNDKNTNI